MHDEETKFFLFLGDANREGVLSKIKTNNFKYITKKLESGTDNWRQIIRIMNRNNITGVIVTFPAHVMRIAASDSHRALAREIFERMKRIPHIIFIHETFFRGTISFEPDGETYSFGHILDDERESINYFINEFNLTIAPYKTNAEMSVLTTEFVDMNGSNLAFRMYIPHERIWSNETRVMIGLFRDYLTRVSGLKVRQEERATPLGTVYELFTDESIQSGGLEGEFREFSRLLDSSLTNPEAARAILERKNLAATEVVSIIDRYAKEARRLHVDIKQDRERKLLSIRHRMEAELVEHPELGSDLHVINGLIESAIPAVAGISSAAGVLTGPTRAGAALTVNLNPQIIQTVNGIVAHEIYGNQTFGADISEVLNAINLYGRDQIPQLTSAVYEIEDPETKPEKRLTALQKLKNFVYMAGQKIPDLALGVLQTYIERKIGL